MYKNYVCAELELIIFLLLIILIRCFPFLGRNVMALIFHNYIYTMYLVSLALVIYEVRIGAEIRYLSISSTN